MQLKHIHLLLSPETLTDLGWRMGKRANLARHFHGDYTDNRPNALCTQGLLAAHPNDAPKRTRQTSTKVRPVNLLFFREFIATLEPYGELRATYRGQISDTHIMSRFLEGLAEGYYTPTNRERKKSTNVQI